MHAEQALVAEIQREGSKWTLVRFLSTLEETAEQEGWLVYSILQATLEGIPNEDRTLSL